MHSNQSNFEKFMNIYITLGKVTITKLCMVKLINMYKNKSYMPIDKKTEYFCSQIITIIVMTKPHYVSQNVSCISVKAFYMFLYLLSHSENLNTLWYCSLTILKKQNLECMRNTATLHLHQMTRKVCCVCHLMIAFL